MKTFIIAAFAAALSAVPALAEDFAPTQDVTVRVSTQGLNLADARDVATLQARVDKATAAACNPRDTLSLSLYTGADRACSRQAAAKGQQIVAQMSREAAKNRMAEF